MNEQHGKRSPWVVGISITIGMALLMLLLWYGRRMSEAILPGMNSARTTSMEPTDVVLRDPDDKTELRLRIPKAYLTKAENWRGGSQRFVWIQTALPELKPTPAAPRRPRPDDPEDSRWLAEWNNGIYITLQNERADSAGGSTRDRWLKTYSVDRHSRSSIAYELVNDDEFGLTFYKSLACGPTEPAGADPVGDREWQCRDSYREYYVSKEGDPVVHISCYADSAASAGHERPGCQAHTSFRGFSLSYIFRSTQLSRWHEFDAAVRRLLESFVTDSRH